MGPGREKRMVLAPPMPNAPFTARPRAFPWLPDGRAAWMTHDAMSSEDRPWPADGPRRLLAIVVVAAVYFAAAKLGLSLAFVAEQVTAVWPPTGIALAAVVLAGPRVWPGIALGIAVGNTLEALVGGAVLRRAGAEPGLERVVDVAALVLPAALGSTI